MEIIKRVFCLTVILSLLALKTPVEASIITGDIPIAGFSKLMKEAGYIYPEGIELLTQIMYHENYANGEEVMYYTGAVVMNRVRSKEFPNTVKKVLYQNNPRQYSTTDKFFTKDIPESVYHLACKVAKGTSDVPSEVLYQAMFQQGEIWKAIPSSYNDKDIEYFCYGR